MAEFSVYGIKYQPIALLVLLLVVVDVHVLLYEYGALASS